MNSVVSVLFEAEEVISSDDESDSDVVVDIEISNQIEEQMLLFPDKSIKYTVTEIESVVSLFIRMKCLYESKGEKLKNNSITRRMKNLLSSRPGYSDISIRSIKYWYVNSEKERLKRGRKVEKSFEEEILGNLMICNFEENETVRR